MISSYSIHNIQSVASATSNLFTSLYALSVVRAVQSLPAETAASGLSPK